VKRPAVPVLGPHRAAVSGVSTHVNARIAASYSVERLAGDVRRLNADMLAGKHADAVH